MPADSDAARRALLPAGLRDGLPPDAAHRAAVVERLIAEFTAHGYERVVKAFQSAFALLDANQ